ncbi:Rad52/Rad22 family DNA repair protein [Thermostichus sp. OS-CIW-29]|jgi:hypothetical protein
MNSFQELRDVLNQPTDPSLIRRRRQGTVDIDYLEWFTVNRILDTHCPGWSGEAVVTTVGDTVIVTYTIRIPTDEGVVSRSATGSEKLGSGFDPVASAEQQAFKRAAARFGIGLDLYDKPAAKGYRVHGAARQSDSWSATRANARPSYQGTVIS